ncbi:hypothetical protein NMY22_g16240 [Coprinellus aureogranulatus]|nr:hypothetical protein NMY22_g16240 [Coprinellus aureogranulatus]
MGCPHSNLGLVRHAEKRCGVWVSELAGLTIRDAVVWTAEGQVLLRKVDRREGGDTAMPGSHFRVSEHLPYPRARLVSPVLPIHHDLAFFDPCCIPQDLLQQMFPASDSHTRKRKRSRSPSGSGNNRRSSIRQKTTPAIPGSATYNQYHGHVLSTTNVYNGPVNNVGHIGNAHFDQSGGIFDALLWNSLPKQRDTSGQQSKYLEGSREGDVQEVLRWIDSAPSGELVLWVRGAAGVGKSTFARHITHLLRDKNRLAASVSISAVPTDARGVESVVKVIAREMITIHPEVIPLVRSAVSSCHGAPLGKHIEKYICDPSRSLRLPGHAIFLLDATDEWEYFDAFVKELESITALSPTLKFVFLGRSDPRTRGLEGPWIRSYRLEPVSGTTMKRYIIRELASVKWDFGRAPSERQIATLVELADGLFIWAKVVCSLLRKKLSLSSASETLEAIIHSRRSVAAEGDLPALYHQAIMWLFPESEDQELLRRYLGAALVLQDPLSVDAFSSLTGLPIHVVESLKEQLAALQIRYPVGDTIPQIHPAYALFHLSFLECCKSFSTSSDVASHVSEFRSHAQLAESCLLELRKFLSNAHPLEPTNLSARQKYAVKHMPLHVHRGTPSVEPESDVDWKRTPHSSLLQDMSIPSLEQWGHLLVSLVLPSSSMAGNSEVPGRSRGGLMVDVAARLKKGPEATLPVQISCLELAVRLEPGSPHCWSELGWAYRSLAMSTRSRDACDQAVQAHRNSLEVDGLSDSDKGHMLFRLGTVLDDRHDYFGSPHDLEEAITVLRSALDACPPGHQDYGSCLNNLSIALRKTGSTSDQQESTRLDRKVLELRLPGHPQRDITLNNLASSLAKTGSPDDLQESIRLNREALELLPPGHPERHYTLNNLARALFNTGSPDNLQESIRLCREALELWPPGHPNRHFSLAGLASTLDKTGSPDARQESIQLNREALELRPPGHPLRDAALHNLAVSLFKKGSPGDLEESIRLFCEELEALPQRASDITRLCSEILLKRLRSEILRPTGRKRGACARKHRQSRACVRYTVSLAVIFVSMLFLVFDSLCGHCFEVTSTSTITFPLHLSRLPHARHTLLCFTLLACLHIYEHLIQDPSHSHRIPILPSTPFVDTQHPSLALVE